jgi:hypothetical protein
VNDDDDGTAQKQQTTGGHHGLLFTAQHKAASRAEAAGLLPFGPTSLRREKK